MGLNQIQKRAIDSLSNNYEGDMRDPYIGMGDHFMDFNGARSFADVLMRKRQFKFKIVHTGSTTTPGAAVTKRIAIHPGYFNTAIPVITQDSSTKAITAAKIAYTDVSELNTAGHDVDAVLSDGTILTYDTDGKIVASCLSGMSIQDFFNFTKLAPAHVPHITLEADNVAAYNEGMWIRECQPFRKFTENPLYLSDYFNVDQYQTGKVELDVPELQLDGQTVLIFDLAPGRTVTFTYWLGGVLNPSAALSNKKMQAYGNISQAQRKIGTGSIASINPAIIKR